MSDSGEESRKFTDLVNSMPKRKGSCPGKYPEAKRHNTKPYTRWYHKGPPITEFKNVPKGWPAEDHDIHEDDVLANIERCKQRIEDGIMPQWWERKLKKYQACKAEFDKEIKSSVPGLDLKVILRLRDLRAIKSGLEKEGDSRKLLPNIEAIIKAYNSKELTWDEGLVTYWSKGVKICDGPKEFKWQDFDSYSEKHQGHEGFWVEGLHGPGPLPVFLNHAPDKRAFTIAPRDAQFLHEVDFALRVPSKPTQNSAGNREDPPEVNNDPEAKSEDLKEENQVSKEESQDPKEENQDLKEENHDTKEENHDPEEGNQDPEKEKDAPEEDNKGENEDEGEDRGKEEDKEEEEDEEDDEPQDPSIEFTFIDDTGSAVMILYEDDLEQLENKASELAKIVGGARLNGAFGGWFVVIHRLEVNMRDQDGEYMLDWTPIQVAVIKGDRPVGHMRLSGPWMRHRFFVGTSPNRKGILCIAKNKSLFVKQIESVPKGDIAGVPADLRLPPNAPGAMFARYRGQAYPGREPCGDSDDDIAVRYYTAKEYQSEEQGNENQDDGPGEKGDENKVEPVANTIELEEGEKGDENKDSEEPVADTIEEEEKEEE